jgi:hypothetical protein
MSQLVIQTSTNACQIWSGNPDINYIGTTTMKLGHISEGGQYYRVPSVFDFSALHSRAVITKAVASFYRSDGGPYNADYTLTMNRVLKQMNINEVTWNSYASSAAWQTPGASGAVDITSTHEASSSFCYWNEWVNVDVTNMVRYAQANTSKILRIRTVASDVIGAADFFTFISSANASESLRPKLTITYRMPIVAVQMF